MGGMPQSPLAGFPADCCGPPDCDLCSPRPPSAWLGSAFAPQCQHKCYAPVYIHS